MIAGDLGVPLSPKEKAVLFCFCLFGFFFVLLFCFVLNVLAVPSRTSSVHIGRSLWRSSSTQIIFGVLGKW